MTRATVLCGFLGAGKTTLLSHVLGSCPAGMRIGVVANDVAKVNVDAKLVREVGKAADGSVETLQLENGCVCCTASGDLVASVEALLTREEPFEHVLIETTGVAEAGQMRELLRNLPSVKAGRAEAPVVVTVVDSRDFMRQFECRDQLKDRADLTGEQLDELKTLVVSLLVEQVEGADLVLLNKVDLIGAESARLAGLREMVAKLNPLAEVLTSEFGKVPLLDLLKETTSATPGEPAAPSGAEDAAPHHHHHHHHHDGTECHGEGCSHGPRDHKSRFGIESFTFTSDKAFHGPRLAKNVLQKMAAAQQSACFEAVDQLEQAFSEESSAAAAVSADEEAKAEPTTAEDSNPFRRLLRSKGFLFLGGAQRERRMYWSHAGRHFSVAPKGLWEESKPQQELVFIGVELDEGAIRKLLTESLED